MALLVPSRGSEMVIILECPDAIIRVRVEEISVDLGVQRRRLRPRLPELIAEGILDELVFRALDDLVHADVWGLGVGVVLCFWFLGW